MTEGEDNGNGSSTPPTAGTSSATAQTGTAAPSNENATTSGGGGGGKKANQAAFIHKLYNMLEDSSISHLISWTPSNESFVITPGEEFSKVLSQYFKHTNVSSFVRQLNMYGFHKVNDTFNSSDYNQWEFKHGGGAFKRGDVESLRAIKRRASRQSMQRDNLQLKSVSLSVPSTPTPDHFTNHSSATNTPPIIYPTTAAHHGAFMTNPMTATQAAPAAAATTNNANNNNKTNTTATTTTNSHPVPPGPAPPPPPPPAMHHENTTNSSSGNVDARLNALEHNIWYLQESNFGLNHKNAILIDALKKTQADMFQLLEFLRSRDIYDETIDMLKSNLSHHMSVLSHFHDKPHTKSDISFNSSSSRERNPSIFYDPLANTPSESDGGVNLPPLNREQRPGSFPVAYYRNKISRPSNAGLRPDTQAFRRHTSGEVPPTNTNPSTLAPIPSVSSRNGSTTSTSTSSGEQPRQGSSVQSLLNPPTEEERSSKRLKTESTTTSNNV